MPLQATSGAASYDAFGGGVAAVPNYIEDVFSTFLYTGDGNNTGTDRATGVPLTVGSTNQTALLWIKNRSSATNHYIYSSPPGSSSYLSSNTTAGNTSSSTPPYGLPQVDASTTGFTTYGSDAKTNQSGQNYVSWTFRKQPKFFDVVTWTGNSTAGRTIAHNLGSAPGFMVVKSTSQASTWAVYHRSIDVSQYVLALNTTDAQFGQGYWNYTAPTSSVFTVGSSGDTNQSGQTYVAYLFAHDAGGFGLTGTDNVISCGSYTTNASAKGSATLGFEPQFLLLKSSSAISDWYIADVMRGQSYSVNQMLNPNNANEEYAQATSGFIPNATGFTDTGNIIANGTVIYIAIRRGPMKVPTSGTSVFDTQLGVSSTTATISSGFVTDTALALSRPNGASGYGRNIYSRLQGNFQSMNTTMTDAESTFINSSTISFSQNNGIKLNGGTVYNANWVYEQFSRAPGFFDEVCYLGTGSTQNVTHNLGVIPGFIVCKRRNGTANWCALAGTSNGTYESLYLNTTVGTLYTAPSAAVAGLTATTFNPQAVFPSEVNTNGDTYVAYLFATCAGVSKVFSYTGNGSSQTINCGFTGGARFVLIKRTDSTGDWYVWDSARGIVSGNDPHLSLNTTAAEVTTDDTIDTDSTGFVVNQVSATDVNVSSATYIGLAIA